MHPRFRRPHGEYIRNRHLQDAPPDVTLDGDFVDTLPKGEDETLVTPEDGTESLKKEEGEDKLLCQRALQRLRQEKNDIESLFKAYE